MGTSVIPLLDDTGDPPCSRRAASENQTCQEVSFASVLDQGKWGSGHGVNGYADEFYCAFIDHRSVPLSELAALLQLLEDRSANRRLCEAQLATCQRFEVYYHGQIFPFPSVFGALSTKAQVVCGRGNVAFRLACIASGSESLLLGERFIPQQVSNSFRHISPNDPLGVLASHALRVAEDCRTSFGFRAEKDYGDVVYDLLACTDSPPPAPCLVVVGSGMLGRALASHPSRKRYESVYAVTRWPKQLRKKLEVSDVLSIRPEHLQSKLGDRRFDVLMAVSNATPEYAVYLAEMMRWPNCRRTIDLSTAPMGGTTPPTNYVHEYDAFFSQRLADLSMPLATIVSPLQAAIRERIGVG